MTGGRAACHRGRRKSGDRAIAGDHTLRVAAPAEVGRAVEAAGPARLPARGVGFPLAQEPQDGVDPDGGLLDRAIVHGAAADLAQDGNVTRDHRRAVRERFDDRQAEPFTIRRQQGERAAPVDRTERRPIDERQDVDRLEHAEIARADPLLGGERTAHPGEPRVRPRPAHAGEDFEQDVDPLPRDRAADVQQLHAAPPWSQHPRRLDVRRGVRLGLAARVRALAITDSRSSGKPASATSAPRVASLSHATCAARRSPDRIRRVIQRNGSERRSSSGWRTDRKVSRS
jgi:hypothetical protein